MKINNSSSCSSSAELVDILNLSVVKKFQKNLREKFGIFFALVDRKRRIISHSPVESGEASLDFLKSIVTKLDVGSSRAHAVFYIMPGLRFHLFPLVFQNKIKGVLVAGPILEKKPDEKSLQLLGQNYDIPAGRLREFIGATPLLRSWMREIAEDLLTHLAETISQFLSERMNYARHFQETFAVHKVVKSLNTTLSLEEVLTTMLQYSIDILDAKNGSVMLLDEENQYLRIFVSCGIDKKIARDVKIPLGEGISGKVATTGVPELLLRGKKSGNNAKGMSLESSGLCAPLVVNEKIIGVITIGGARSNRDFSLRDLEVLDVIASSAAVAINNARLYESLRRKVQEHATLLYVANALSSSLDPTTVLQEVLDKAIRLLDASKGSLMLIDEETQELRIVNAYGLSEEIIANTRIRIGEGISGKVAKDGQPLLIKKGVRIADSQSEKSEHELDSTILVPVKIKEKVIGVLNIRDHVDGSNFNEEHVGLLQMMASQAAIAIENSRLHKELKELFIGSVKALINAIEARDPYTKGHSIRVTHYSLKIAGRLDMSCEEIENLQYAALLHDIGKINIKDDILLKPGKLTAEETNTIQKHPSYGASIMQPVRAFQKILPALYCHHERYDGTGYSQHLCGKNIPIESRIIAVADSFDAMTSDRPYRKALSIREAVKELKENAGSQFDPEIVSVFLKLLRYDKTCHPSYNPDDGSFV